MRPGSRTRRASIPAVVALSIMTIVLVAGGGQVVALYGALAVFGVLFVVATDRSEKRGENPFSL